MANVHTVSCKWKFIAFNYNANGISVEKFLPNHVISGRCQRRKSLSTRKSRTFRKKVRFLCTRNRCETCVGAENSEHTKTMNIRIALSRMNVRRKSCSVHENWCKMIQLFVFIKSIGDNIALYTFSWCRMINPLAGFADGCVRSPKYWNNLYPVAVARDNSQALLSNSIYFSNLLIMLVSQYFRTRWILIHSILTNVDMANNWHWCC